VDETATTQLLARAAAGDADAWAAIVHRYERLLWSVARSFRYDDATTADVLQTVWLRLAEHCDRIRDPERLGSWLAITCRNECLSVGRRRHREVSDPRVSDLVESQERGPLGNFEERPIEDETHREVLLAFTRLPESCQQLLRLACADPPLDYQTISELTGRPVGSIGPTRQRCLGKLRVLMETTDA
jgi:RNA polymerase sigma factor (sigma-70 family)